MTEATPARARPQLVRARPPSTATIPFLLNGLQVHARKGDTVLTALLTQAGHLRTSEFLARPRAGFCLMGACQDCWVSCSDGRRVRSCTTLIEPGMSLCLPPAAFSCPAKGDTPVPGMEETGGCTPPHPLGDKPCFPQQDAAQSPVKRTMNPRIIVIGGGPAGIRACEILVSHGLQPTLIDESPRPGGQIYRQPPQGRERPARALYGFEARKARRLHETAQTLLPHIDYHPETLVWNAAPGMLDLHGPQGMARQAYTHLILATGATDRILPFEGWTIPGVYSLGGAQVSLKHQDCLVGNRVAFVGTGPLLYLVAYQYARQGAHVAGVFDSAPFSAQLRALPGMCRKPAVLAKGLYYLAWLRARGIPIHTSCTPVRVEGSEHVQGLRVRQGSREWTVACDAVATGYGLRSETQLPDLLECEFDYSPLHRAWLPRLDPAGRSSVAGIYLAGDGAGIGGADMAEIAGARAALALLADIGRLVPLRQARSLERRINRWRAFRHALERAFPFPDWQAWPRPGHTLLCRCEEVTCAQAVAALQMDGQPELNRIKALCRVGMGRCQGRMCSSAAAELLAAQGGIDTSKVGRLRSQAPVKPIPLTALGADPSA